MNIQVLAARKDLRLTQGDVAEKAGLDRRDIVRIERGWVPPRDVQEKVAQVVKKTAKALFGEQLSALRF